MLKNEGSELRSKGKIKEAISFFKKKMDAGDNVEKANASCNLALIYKDKLEKASLLRAWYFRKKYHYYLNNSIKYDFSFPICCFLYADLMHKRKDFSTALAFIEKALNTQKLLEENTPNESITKKDKQLAVIRFSLFKAIYLMDSGESKVALDNLYLALDHLINLRQTDTEEASDLSNLIIEHLLVIHFMRNEFSEASKMLKVQLNKAKSERSKSDESLKLLENASISLESLERIPWNFVPADNVSSFVSKYYSEIQKADSFESCAKLRRQIIDGFYSSKFANLFLQIGENILELNKQVERDLEKGKTKIHGIDLVEPKSVLTDLETIKTLSPDLRKEIENNREFYEQLYQNQIKFKESLESMLNVIIELNRYQSRHIKALSEETFKVGFRNRLNWFLIISLRQSSRATILAFFFGTLIPFVISGYLVYLIPQALCMLLLWIIGEKYVEPKITTIALNKCAFNLRDLLFRMGTEMYLKYNTLIKILSASRVAIKEMGSPIKGHL